MEKSVVIYSYSGTLYSKENKTQVHTTKWMTLPNIMLKKPDTKECVPYDSIYIRYKTRQN